MLPFCERIVLYDYSPRNVDWLSAQLPSYDASWDKFWGVLERHPTYSPIPDARQRLSEIGRVIRGSVFDLPAREWDIGTMFFVAESMTEDMAEFRLAVSKFAGALREGAPFAAAFMADSQGYFVDGVRFPAVAINRNHVAESFAGFASGLRVFDVTSEQPLRKGYDGMIVATGRIAAASDLRRDDENSAKAAVVERVASTRQ